MKENTIKVAGKSYKKGEFLKGGALYDWLAEGNIVKNMNEYRLAKTPSGLEMFGGLKSWYESFLTLRDILAEGAHKLIEVDEAEEFFSKSSEGDILYLESDHTQWIFIYTEMDGTSILTSKALSLREGNTYGKGILCTLTEIKKGTVRKATPEEIFEIHKAFGELTTTEKVLHEAKAGDILFYKDLYGSKWILEFKSFEDGKIYIKKRFLTQWLRKLLT